MFLYTHVYLRIYVHVAGLLPCHVRANAAAGYAVAAAVAAAARPVLCLVAARVGTFPPRSDSAWLLVS